jgi:hypothetical protein
MDAGRREQHDFFRILRTPWISGECQESPTPRTLDDESTVLGGAKCAILFFLRLKFLHSFCKIFKSYVTSDKWFEGNIFLIALAFNIILCSYSGMANHATQWKKELARHTV